MSVGQKLFVDSSSNGLSVEQKIYCLLADRCHTSLVVGVVASYKSVVQRSRMVGIGTLAH